MKDVQGYMRTGIGKGDAKDYRAGSAKTCVSNPLGSLNVLEGQGEDLVARSYPVYESVSFVEPPSSPRVVDVYIDNKLFKSTRY